MAEAGRPSFTEEEAKKLGKKIPPGSVIIYPGVSPSQAAELASGKKSSTPPPFLPKQPEPPPWMGGGSSGGGGSGGGSSQPQSSLANPTQPVYQSTLLNQTFNSAAAKAAAESAYRQQQAEQRRQQIVVSAAGVKKNNVTYYGQAVVPGTNMSASKYRQSIQRQAIKSGQVKLGQQRFYNYTVSEKPTKQIQQPTINNAQFPQSDVVVSAPITYGRDPTTPYGVENKNVAYNYLTTEPTLKGISNKNVFGQSAQFFKYITFKPAAAFGEGVSDVGSFIKSSGKPTSQVTGTVVGAAGTLIPRTPVGQIALAGGVKIFGSLPKIGKTAVRSYFAYSGTKATLNPDLTPEERVAGGIIGTAGIASLVLPAPRYFTEPVRIETPIRKVITPKATEVAYTVVSKGKEYNFAEYNIAGEISPPKVVRVTTAFREDISPSFYKEIYTKPARTFSIQTIEPVLKNKPFIVSEVRQESNVAKLNIISGGTEEFNPRLDFNKLTKTEQFALKSMVETEIGRPISTKNFNKYFKRDSDYTRGIISNYKLAEINTRTKMLKFYGDTGKRTTLTQTITKTIPTISSDKVDVYYSKTVFKDVTKPFARSTGNIPKLDTTLYQFKEPIILDVEPVKSIAPAEITKTPYDYAKQTPTTKQIPEPLKKILPKIETPTETRTTTKNVFNNKEISVAGNNLYSTGSTRNIISVKGMSKLKGSSKLKEVTKLKETSKLKEVTKLKESNKLKETTKLKDVLKLKQLSKEKPMPLIFPTARIPKVPEKSIGKIFSKKSTAFSSGKSFNVFGRRFGKFKLVGSSKTERGAFSLGKAWTGKTLGATFKIPKAKARKLPGFRTKKTNEGVLYIEPRGKRLKRGTYEVPEIMMFKDLKGGKK